MPLTIPVAHDFICSWCWIGWHQVEQLRKEFDVEFDWLGFELYPEAIPWPEPPTIPTVASNRPATPSRLDLAYAAQGIAKPTALRPNRMRDHAALESVEHAKELGFGHEWVGRLYRAYWEDGDEIGSLDVLMELGRDWFSDLDGLRNRILDRHYTDRIVGFNEQAYAAGVYNLPTFFIGGGRYAEQPYVVLRDAMEAALVNR
ncbi:MAG: hypothetical protein HONBIEJF_01356 [Fimbriimonadaceae bacterium]|nr:hypothetical protein [Fimbriimonadaceae bacterium]